jgi:hypothetical protein
MNERKERAVDQELENLLRQLGEAVNDSISSSSQVTEAIARIKASGYDIFVILEATVGFNKHGGEEVAASVARAGDPEWHLSPQDARFLKSLRISLDSSPSRKPEKNG